MELADVVKQDKITDDAVRQQMREEIGDQELTQTKKFAILQKYGILTPRRHLRSDGTAMPGLDKQIDNPGWVPENGNGGDNWKKRRQLWINLVSQAKKSR